MAHAFTLAELANLAIGTPEVGVCNFNAMHALLHGILEQLEIGHVTKMVDQEEKEFIKPSGPLPTEGDDEEEEEEQAAAAGAGGKAKAKTKAKAPKPVVGKSLFHQLEEKVSRLQAAFEALNQLPTAADLLSKSGPASQAPPAVQASGSSGAVKDMWQLMQLRKKTEANEDGINKVMATLQELMNEMNSMNATNERLRKEVDKFNSSKLQNLEEQLKATHSIEDRLNAFPEPKDLVLWGDLQKLLDKELELEEKIRLLELPTGVTFEHTGMELGDQQFQVEDYGAQLGVASSLHDLVKAASGHYTLKDKVVDLEKELRERLAVLDKKGIPDDLLERLNLLESGLQQLHNEVNKDKELLTSVKKNLEEIQEDLDNRLSSIQSDHDELQDVQEKIEILEEKKADKEALEMEINVKADKKALEAKVSRALLDATAQQLNAMMQELLNKVCAQEKDWQKVLEKLLCDMDCKLDRMELDPLKKQLEERWRQLKKQLKSGPGFEADSAAGFRKQLLERFKCISCAKSTRMLPGPHLITVAASALHPRVRPTTAPELDSVKGQRGMYGEYYDHLTRNSSRPCGGSHTVTGPISRRNNRNLNLQTVYQYGDPSGGFRREEVEIQGIDGIMYKGRLDPKLPMMYQSQETEAPAVEKKASGTNVPSSQPENGPPTSMTPRCIYCHQTSSSPRTGELCNSTQKQDIGMCRCSGTGSRDFSATPAAPRDVCATLGAPEASSVCRCPGVTASPAPLNGTSGQDPAASDRATQERCAGRGPVKVFCPQNGNVDCPRPSTAGCICPERAATDTQNGEPPNSSQPPPS